MIYLTSVGWIVTAFLLVCSVIVTILTAQHLNAEIQRLKDENKKLRDNATRPLATKGMKEENTI